MTNTWKNLNLDSDEELPEEPPRFSKSQPLGELFPLDKIQTEQQELSKRVANHRIDRDDPLYEVLEVVEAVKKRVDNLSVQVPTQMADVMLNQAENIEQRVILAVRQYQQMSSVIDINPILDVLGRFNQTTQIELTQQTDRLSQIALKPQKVPMVFYAVVASFGLLSLFASAFTWKTVNERVEVANWINSPDGKLARQIVLANKDRLNKQCQESTLKLNKVTVINGIQRDKLCFVAIP
jgi:hypothetical protein